MHEFFIILDRDGTLYERSAGDMTHDNTVSDILTGQVDSVGRVLCINLEEKSCIDRTEDIAHEVWNEASPHERLSKSALDLIEQELGIGLALRAERFGEQFA